MAVPEILVNIIDAFFWFIKLCRVHRCYQSGALADIQAYIVFKMDGAAKIISCRKINSSTARLRSFVNRFIDGISIYINTIAFASKFFTL